MKEIKELEKIAKKVTLSGYKETHVIQKHRI